MRTPGPAQGTTPVTPGNGDRSGGPARDSTGVGRAGGLARSVPVLLRIVPVGWGTGASFPWESDNLAPGPVLKGMAVHFGPGWCSTHGPRP